MTNQVAPNTQYAVNNGGVNGDAIHEHNEKAVVEIDEKGISDEVKGETFINWIN